MAQTQNLILRIIAQRKGISSTELVEVVRKFGRSADAVRAAVSRMVRAKLLIKKGRGRGNLSYKLGPAGQARVAQFINKILRWHVALEDALPWDGNWLVVAFNVPEKERDKRDTFRAALMDMGFGLLSSSVWLSPLDLSEQVSEFVEDLGLAGQATLLRCQHIWQPGQEGNETLVRHVWELEALEAKYNAFNAHAEVLLTSLDKAAQTATANTEALFFEVLELQSELIEIIMDVDPCLPVALLPTSWPGKRVHELVHALTRTIDTLSEADHPYHYLFHLIQGMEDLEAFRPEGDMSFHWPSEDELTR